MTKSIATLGVLVAATAIPGYADPLVEPNYDHVDTSRWRCRLCPFDLATAARGRWHLGTLAVDDAHPRFGRDNGLDEARSYVDANAELTSRGGDGRYLLFDGADLGVDARQAELRAGHDARYGVVVQWREVPRNVATDGRTPYTGRTSLELPDAWIIARAATPHAPDAGFRSVDYGTARRRAAVRLAVEPARRIGVQAFYMREAKTGSRETYADRLYQATGLPKAIEHTTEELGGQVAFTSRPWLLAAEVRRSRFRNAHTSLEWENAFSSLGHPSSRVALAPDNDAATATLASRATFGRTRFSAHLNWGRHRQDDAFLPYTTNSVLSPPPLPAMGLGGRVQTFAGALNLVSQITERLRMSLSHREHERANTTPTLMLAPVLGDLIKTPARPNRAYDLRREKTEAGLRYRFGARTTLALGAEAIEVQRTPLEIGRNDERSAWIDLVARGLRGVTVSFKVAQAARDASAFQDLTRNNPLTRRFYQAAREERVWRTRVDYRPPVVDLSLGVDVDIRETSYPDSQLGLRRERDRGWGVDVSYAPAAKVSLSAFLSSRVADATTAGSQALRRNARDEWRYGTEDQSRTVGFVARASGVLHANLDVALTYNQSLGRGRYDTVVDDGVHAFPDLVSDHRSLEIVATYRWRRQTAVIARWYREDYASADWALDGVTPSAIRNVLAFGRRTPLYTTGFFGLSVERRWSP